MILRSRFASAIGSALLVVLASGCGAASSGGAQVADPPSPTPSGLNPTAMVTQSGPPTATVDSIARHDVDVAISGTVTAVRAYRGHRRSDNAIRGYAQHAAAQFRYVAATLHRIHAGAPAALVQRAASAAAAAQDAMQSYGRCLANAISNGVHRSGCAGQQHAAERLARVALDRVFDLGSFSSQSHAQLVRLADSVR